VKDVTIIDLIDYDYRSSKQLPHYCLLIVSDSSRNSDLIFLTLVRYQIFYITLLLTVTVDS